MATLDIPTQGLELLDVPVGNDTPSTSNPTLNTRQVMLLDVPGSFLDEILTNARSGGKDTQITLGKAPALNVKGKQHTVHLTPTQTAFKLLFSINKRIAPPAKKTLQCEGFVTRQIRLGNIKVAETEENDPALLALQRGLADAEKKKRSNTTIFLKDSRLPTKGKAKAKAGPLAFLKKSQLPGIFDHRNATTRSMPASPSLAAVAPPKPRQDEKARKAEAMKTALIHLLAVRPVSERFICNTLKCTPEEIKGLLHTYGRESPIDKKKLMLSDRGYQILDVWKFPYASQDDRQAAIDRAIKAFDRRRVSREENAWQLLLPKKDRGKGIILSLLNLHGHPIDQIVGTPRINVQDADGTKLGGDATGTDGAGTDSDNRRGRLAPDNSQPIARSRSQDSIKKQRVSEKEAQSRRLLSKNPKKASQAAVTKRNKVTMNKEAKTAGSTDTTKVKSAEFVRDSDEDVEMEDVAEVESTQVNSRHVKNDSKRGDSNTKKDTASQKVLSKPENFDPKRSVAQKTLPQKILVPASKANSEKKPTLTNSSSSGSINRLSDTSQASTDMRRTISHKRTTSSPIKPSPLGSSPPANASDFDNEKRKSQGSSSSASPLVQNCREDQNVKTDGVTRSVNKVSSNRLERGDSDRGLKRKAKDLDSEIRNHEDAKLANGIEPPAKRQQTYTDSSPTSDSSSAASPSISSSIIPMAQEFKKFYQTYQTAHREVVEMDEPPQDKVEKVLRMHKRLVEMKAEITKAVAS
ncbi:hypothetical protein MMC26_000389 [Xylographa opegraphella]|nr:hypothetical protein [Xylographa opegraphella]